MKIHWKLIIYQNFRVVFQISQPGNIPQKWFSTQNEPLSVTFQMRLTPNHGNFSFFEKSNRKHGATLKSVFKRMHRGFCLISPEIRSLHGWGQSHLKRDIQSNSELLVNDQFSVYSHMGSFPHPTHYFAAAGENDDFVIAVINFQLNQYFWKFVCYLFGYVNIQISNMKTNGNF